MLKLQVWLADFVRSERGQDMVEYALVTAVISMTIVLAAILTPGLFGAWANSVASCVAAPNLESCAI